MAKNKSDLLLKAAAPESPTSDEDDDFVDITPTVPIRPVVTPRPAAVSPALSDSSLGSEWDSDGWATKEQEAQQKSKKKRPNQHKAPASITLADFLPPGLTSAEMNVNSNEPRKIIRSSPKLTPQKRQPPKSKTPRIVDKTNRPPPKYVNIHKLNEYKQDNSQRKLTTYFGKRDVSSNGHTNSTPPVQKTIPTSTFAPVSSGVQDSVVIVISDDDDEERQRKYSSPTPEVSRQLNEIAPSELEAFATMQKYNINKHKTPKRIIDPNEPSSSRILINNRNAPTDLSNGQSSSDSDFEQKPKESEANKRNVRISSSSSDEDYIPDSKRFKQPDTSKNNIKDKSSGKRSRKPTTSKKNEKIRISSSSSDEDYIPDSKRFKQPDTSNNNIKDKSSGKRSRKPTTSKKNAKIVPEDKQAPKKPAGKKTTFKRVKGIRPKDQENQQNFSSVKLKLRTILTETEENNQISRIRKIITEHSIRATKISTLASLLLLVKVNHHFDTYNQNDDFFNSDPDLIVKDCFYEVLDPEKKQKGKRYTAHYLQYRHQQFETLLGHYNIQRPNNDYMGNMHKYLFQMYAANFKVNICLHGRKRIWNFFKTIPGVSKMQRKHMVEHLFDTRSQRQPNDILMNSLRNLDPHNRYDWDVVGCLAYFQNNWFYYVPLFVKIQRHVYAYNMQHAAEWLAEDEANKSKKGKEKSKHKHLKVKAMTIVPLCKYKRQHIRIDSAGLFKLFQEMKVLPEKKNNPLKDIDEAEFIPRADEFWSVYFNMDNINHIKEKANNKLKFAYQITTDGISASILYETSLPTEVNMEKKLAAIVNKLENKEYKYYTSIDVGYNTWIAAVVQNVETKEEFNVKIKSKRHHRSTRNNIRKNRFKTLVGKLEKEAADDRERLPVMPTPTGPNYLTYVHHCLQFWERKITAYVHQDYASLAFDKYLNCQKRMDGIVSLLSNREPTLFGIGGADFNPNSPIKGHQRCPGIRKFVKANRKYPENSEFFIDEYNTSQHCGLCCSKFDRSTKRDRFKRCVNCTTTSFLIPKAPRIRTEIPPRLKQRLRKLQISNLQPGQRKEDLPKLKYVKYSNTTPRVTTWQRDIAACRLIGYKGMNALLGLHIDQRLRRPTNNDSDSDSDHEGDENLLLQSELPQNIVWC